MVWGVGMQHTVTVCSESLSIFFIMSTQLDILFLLFPSSAVRHSWFPVILRKSIYPIFTTFGMGVYWVNSLHGIAFDEDSSIAN